MQHWIGQRTVARRSAWVARVGARPPCPLVPLVGACCSGCAEGKGCRGEEEAHELVARVGANDLPAFSEDAYPWSVAEDMDRTIATLDGDLKRELASYLAAHGGTPSDAWIAISNRWGAFLPAWQAWWGKYREDWIAHLGPIVGEKKVPFDALVKELNGIVADVKAAQIPTTAAPVDLRSPLDKAGTAASEGFSNALQKVTDVLTQGGIYLLLGAGALAIVWYGGPVLLSRLAKGARKVRR